MYPKALIDYLVYFHGPRDYFECHEVLEEHWKEDKPEERKKYWVGLIQIAVSLYHHRLGNFNGAKRLMKNAIAIIKNEKQAIEELGFDYAKLVTSLEQRLEEIKNNRPYSSINLPVNDENLHEQCIEQCKNEGHTWGEPSDLTNKSLIQKHSLRDRTEVIEEREYQQKIKRNNRGEV